MNRVDPMGTDSVGISGGEVTWQGFGGTSLTAGITVGGPLNNPLIMLLDPDRAGRRGILVSYNDLRRIAESKTDHGLGAISGGAGKLRAINTIVGNAAGIAVTQRTVATEAAAEAVAHVHKLDTNPASGAIRAHWDEGNYIRAIGWAWAYNFENTVTIGAFERQDFLQGDLDRGQITLTEAKSQTRWNVARAGVGTVLGVSPLRGGLTPATTKVVANETAKRSFISGLKITPEELAQLERETAERLAASTFQDGVLYASDYREIFFSAFPNLRNQVVVHHSVEQQVLTRFPGRFTEAEINSLSFLRGIPNSINSEVHLSMIRTMWNEFYALNPAATRSQILDFAQKVDQALEGVIIKPTFITKP